MTKLTFQNLALSEKPIWYRDIWTNEKLKLYRMHKRRYSASLYTTYLPRHQCSVIAMSRCGSLPLQVETGRWNSPKTPLEQSTCLYCPGQVEDEVRFVISCQYYNDLIYNLVNSAVQQY